MLLATHWRQADLWRRRTCTGSHRRNLMSFRARSTTFIASMTQPYSVGQIGTHWGKPDLSDYRVTPQPSPAVARTSIDSFATILLITTMLGDLHPATRLK